MANVKKQAKNTIKGKTDKRTAKSVSQTPAHPYKKRIILFSILSLICLILAIISNGPEMFGVFAFGFAWIASAMTIVTIFPNLKTDKIKTHAPHLSKKGMHYRDGQLVDLGGHPSTLDEEKETF